MQLGYVLWETGEFEPVNGHALKKTCFPASDVPLVHEGQESPLGPQRQDGPNYKIFIMSNDIQLVPTSFSLRIANWEPNVKHIMGLSFVVMFGKLPKFWDVSASATSFL